MRVETIAWGTEYNDSDSGRELGKRARKFMDEVVLPVEREHPGGEPVSDGVIEELSALPQFEQ